MSARIHTLSNALRVSLIGLGLLAAAASSGSQGQSQPVAPGGQQQFGSPAPRAMQPDRAIGLWKTSFGPVKIERDPNAAQANGVQGAWRYTQGRREVIGVFWGTLRGNVLDFNWHEPGEGGDLRGQGYLVFDTNGDKFNGKWWTMRRDKSGDWNGWRPASATPAPAGDDQFGEGGEGGEAGDTYGDPTTPPPY